MDIRVKGIRERVVSISVVFIVLFSAVTGSFANRTVQIPKISAPVIDGKLDEESWQDAAILKDFTTTTNHPTKRDTAYIGYDDKNLYIGFQCQESRMDKVRAKITERDGQIYAEDSLEIFLDTSYDRETYYQLNSNLLGTQSDRVRETGITGGDLWNGKWFSAGFKGKDYWSIEVAIPFTTLGISSLKSGTMWGINICRNSTPVRESSSWIYVGGYFHNPGAFGTIVFGSYREQLKAELEKLKKSLAGIKEKIKTLDSTTEAYKKSREAIKGLDSRVSQLDEQISGASVNKERWSLLSEDIISLQQRIVKVGSLGEDYLIWHKNPMEKLFIEEFPETTEDIKEVSISCYTEEEEPAAFIMTNLKDEAIIGRIILNELVDEGSGRWISPYHIKVRTASFVRALSGQIFADALPLANQANEVILIPKRPTQVWLTIDTHGVPPGEYLGKITFKPHYGAKEKSVNLRVKVYPMEMPSQPPVDFGTWGGVSFYRYLTPRGISGFADDLAKHRVTVYFVFGAISPMPVYDDKGNLIEPLEKDKLSFFDKTILPYKQNGMKLYFYLPHPFGHFKHGLHTKFEFLGPEYKRITKGWFKAMVAHLKELGLDYDDYAFCLWDEVSGERLEKAGRFNKFVKEEVDSRIRFWQTLSGHFSLEDAKSDACQKYIDILVPSQTFIEKPEMLQALKQAKGKLFTYRAGYTAKGRSPIGWYRKRCWDAWKYGLDGSTFWMYNQVNQTGWKLTRGGWKGDIWDDGDTGYGDASLIYDEHSWPTGEPATSRRWEAFREGIEDYCYLWLLKETIEKAKKEGIDTIKAEEILSRFIPDVYDSRDADAILRYRDKIAAETVRLNQEVPLEIEAPEVKVKGRDVLISWKTSQLCQGKVYYYKQEKRALGHGNPISVVRLWKTASSPKYSKNLEVKVEDITPGEYLFFTSSKNETGYLKIDDNQGTYYKFER